MDSDVEIGTLLISGWQILVRHIFFRYRNNRCRCRMSDITDIEVDVDAHLWISVICSTRYLFLSLKILHQRRVGKFKLEKKKDPAAMLMRESAEVGLWTLVPEFSVRFQIVSWKPKMKSSHPLRLHTSQILEFSTEFRRKQQLCFLCLTDFRRPDLWRIYTYSDK
jgi:hypothetical protein